MTGRPYIVLLLLTSVAVRVHGQSWVAAGLPCATFSVEGVHVDTVADALYYCGESSANNDFDVSDGVVSVYKNGLWDTIGFFQGQSMCAVRWRDTLVIAGHFESVNWDTNIKYIAYYDSTTLHPYGEFTNGGIEDLKVIDGELYAIGAFEEADGHYCNGIARRTDGGWVNVGTMDTYTNNNLLDLVKWHDTLITTGTIGFNGGLPGDVAWFDGSEWHPLGTGITGGFSAGRSLCVYQDDLYVGGSIYLSAGNAGHGIMRWDGTQYHPVGGSLQGSCGTTNCAAGAIDMKVHDGLLFVSGAFSYAGYQPTTHIATWDGTQWCGMPGVLQGPVEAFNFYHDTLFAAPFLDAEGVNVNSGAKFIDTTYFSTCSGPMVVVQAATGQQQPSMVCAADGTWLVSGLAAGTHQLAVLDLSGRVVHVQQIQASDGRGAPVPLPPLARGVYLLRDGQRAMRFFAP